MKQSTIFVELKPLLKEKKFNTDIDAFSEFMSKYRVGDWVYPSALHRVLRIEIVEVYKILDYISEAGYMEQYLQVYCPYCQKFTGETYKTYMDIPDYLSCIHCDREIEHPQRHAVIIYKVVK